MPQEDREAMTQVVKEAAGQLHDDGIRLTFENRSCAGTRSGGASHEPPSPQDLDFMAAESEALEATRVPME